MEMFEDYTDQEKLKLAGFVTLQIENVLKNQGMPPKLVEFCKIIAGSKTPVKDNYFINISLLKGFNWRKKDIVAFRRDLANWQSVNGEFLTVQTTDNKSFSYKITENLQSLLLEELKKHFLKVGLITEEIR